jgi:hypothetical protein
MSNWGKLGFEHCCLWHGRSAGNVEDWMRWSSHFITPLGLTSELHLVMIQKLQQAI